jgi:hypothetical protein
MINSETTWTLQRLTSELAKQFEEFDQLETEISNNLKMIAYEL